MSSIGLRQNDEHVQGFLASDGKFLKREEAYMVAVRAGQIDWNKKTAPKYVLFSEDLW